MTIKSVKYLYKYIYKRHDCAVLINEQVNHEINTSHMCQLQKPCGEYLNIP